MGLLIFLGVLALVSLWTFASIYYFASQLGNAFHHFGMKQSFIKTAAETILLLPVFCIAYLVSFFRWINK